jgi:hypothetical protein
VSPNLLKPGSKWVDFYNLDIDNSAIIIFNDDNLYSWSNLDDQAKWKKNTFDKKQAFKLDGWNLMPLSPLIKLIFDIKQELP